MNDFIRLLKAIIALIRSIVQSDLYETPDEVRTAIEKAVKDSGVTSLVARFEAAFKSRYFGNQAFTQTQAFEAACKEMQQTDAAISLRGADLRHPRWPHHRPGNLGNSRHHLRRRRRQYSDAETEVDAWRRAEVAPLIPQPSYARRVNPGQPGFTA